MDLASVKAFKQLLWCDSVRGEDSTGVAAIKFHEKNPEVAIMRALGSAEYVMNTKAFESNVNSAKQVLIGHNRYATVGGKLIGNAHPFRHGKIVGAHNGTLPLDARKRLGNENDFGTDSEQLIHSINERGVRPTVELINGAWTVVFANTKESTINFFRNKERDLWLALSKDHKKLFWSSEADLLEWVLGRNSIAIDDLWQLPLGKHVAYAVPKYGQVFNTEANACLAELKEHVAPTVVSRFPQQKDNQPWQGWSPQKEVNGNNVVPFGTGGTNTPTKFEDINIPDDIETMTDEEIEEACKKLNWKPPEERTYVNPRTAKVMSRQEFDDLTKHGCDWCSSNIEYGSNPRFVCDVASGEVECFCETCSTDKTDLKHYLFGGNAT